MDFAQVLPKLYVGDCPIDSIAYLHWVLGWNLDEAWQHVIGCRSCNPYMDAIRLATEDRKRQ